MHRCTVALPLDDGGKGAVNHRSGPSAGRLVETACRFEFSRVQGTEVERKDGPMFHCQIGGDRCMGVLVERLLATLLRGVRGTARQQRHASSQPTSSFSYSAVQRTTVLFLLCRISTCVAGALALHREHARKILDPFRSTLRDTSDFERELMIMTVTNTCVNVPDIYLRQVACESKTLGVIVRYLFESLPPKFSFVDVGFLGAGTTSVLPRWNSTDGSCKGVEDKIRFRVASYILSSLASILSPKTVSSYSPTTASLVTHGVVDVLLLLKFMEAESALEEDVAEQATDVLSLVDDS